LRGDVSKNSLEGLQVAVDVANQRLPHAFASF
jgi:hypothetical protein